MTPYGCQQACDNCSLCGTRTSEWCENDCWKCGVCKFRHIRDLGHTMSLQQRPLYWRPHYYSYPKTCNNTCGKEICDKYETQKSLYQECLNNKTLAECRKQYGCQNSQGNKYLSTSLIDPLYSGCIPCWK
jgi:hypothetical protein